MTRTTMKKFIGSIKRSSTSGRSKSNDRRNGSLEPQNLPQGDHPEAVVVREAVAFCEAGAPGSPHAGEEYLHLPAIVDASESSPAAAREVASTLERYFSRQNFPRGYAQYNAVMLMRILTDNPGRIFTQNFDKSFISTIKTLLRECQDSSVQQITRETLDYFEAEKLNGNDSLMPLVEMWRKEKGQAARMYSTSVGLDGTAIITQDFAYNDQGRIHTQPGAHAPRESRHSRALPPPDELAARIEEARTSARLLVQMVQSTPPTEFLGNELIKEFSERARQAHKSVQQYMACENPAPDEHTMLTLIETSEQLNIAMTKHQRAALQARRATGQASTGTSPQPQTSPQDPFSTTSMQNALPALPARNSPQPPQSTQSRFSHSQYQQPQQPLEQTSFRSPRSPQQPPQNRQQYNRYESEDLYNNAASAVSPIDSNDRTSFAPPPGPPPSKRQDFETSRPSQPPPQTQPESQSYQPYERTPVSTVRPADNIGTDSAAKDYDVSENPFADENAYSAQSHAPISSQTQSRYQQPESNSYSIFNRAAGQLRDPSSPTYNNPSDGRPVTAELDSSSYPAPPPQTDREGQGRPELHGYNSGWQPTPSFIGRQQSSEAHITMSGASPK